MVNFWAYLNAGCLLYRGKELSHFYEFFRFYFSFLLLIFVLLLNIFSILNPLKELISSTSDDDEGESKFRNSNCNFLLQGCHAFYDEKDSNMHISNLGKSLFIFFVNCN